MNKILVLTDFTETSRYGLDLAVDLAKNTGSTVILMNLIFPASESGFSAMGDINVHNEGEMSRFAVELMRTNNGRLLEQISRYKDEDVEFLPRIEIVESDKEVEKLIKKYKPDTLVIGNNESKSFSEYFFGSDTEKLIKISEIPVISTRKDIENYYPHNIVCALDIDDEEKINLSVLKDISEEFNSKVHLLYVLDDGITNSKAIEKLKKLADQYKIDNYSINTVKNNSAEHAIRNFSKRKSADLLALVSEGKTGLKDMLFGSFTNDIVNNVDIPVLVMNPEK